MTLPITDSFGRIHNYLRISLTDKCNLRCSYCMPQEDMRFMPSSQLMSAEEIERIATIFLGMGVTKIRLTGGEPLVRKDAERIIRSLGALPVQLTLTTNGVYIPDYLDVIKSTGIRSVNISFDTLQHERFHSITRRNHHAKTWANIQLLLREGIKVKLNMVVMKDVNEDEVNDFVQLTLSEENLDVRFIEFMPFNGNQWDFSKIVSYQNLLEQIRKKFTFHPVTGDPHETARIFRADKGLGTFGIISTITNQFCSGCNRIRLTADGKLKNCLFDTSEVDLLTPLRKGEDIRPFIYSHFQAKHFAHGGHPEFNSQAAKSEYEQNRKMIAIGG